MKKILAVFMTLCLLMLSACGGNKDGNSNNGTQQGSNNEDGHPEYVTEPISIEFWHTFGSGQAAAYMEDAVKRFNETNEYGITVVSNYIGGYVTLRSSLTTAIGSKTNPQVAILGLSDILASHGVLCDMSSYAERDGIDLDAFIDGVQTSMYYEDALTAMPFVRSCTLFYYNIDMWNAAGFTEPPKTIEELEQQAAAVAAKNGCAGFCMPIDVSFYQEALLNSMGAEGIIDEDHKGASCLEDGTLETLLTDWKSWIDEGWCVAPALTDTINMVQQQLFAKELASCVASSGSMGAILTYAEQAGVNIGVAPMPGYEGAYGVGSGGDVSIISANNNEQQMAASWEFVKFLMTDEEIALRSEMTGYLPVTSASAALMEDLFSTNENYQIAYDARLDSVDLRGSTYRSEWQTHVSAAVSYVVQDKSMTPKEAVEYLKEMSGTVFY
ncbi:MAG: extracellular solute-binding protein [Tyzzerella sp.]|nr:extracellular solute-binding protein [Tyzzerella sp.]